MATKNFRGAPFGIQTARFDVAGVHPKSKRPGTYTQIPYCKKAMDENNRKLGPGAYHVDVEGFSEKAVAERADGPGWARAYEVARMAALPHLLHKEQWELKRLLEKRLGPGSYDIQDFLAASEQKPRSTRGVCQTKEPRFRDTAGKSTDLPGPGTYGIGGIPHKALEERQKKSASTIGMLDAGASGTRTLPQVGSDLGPGCYNFSSFTEDMLKKSVSQRGPYDLFTGERNKPVTTGHYAVPLNQHLGPGTYQLGSFTDDMNSGHSRKKGKFGTVAQYPVKGGERLYVCTLSQMPRDPEDPSPDKYDPKIVADIHYNAKKTPGFLSSAQRNDRMAQKFFTQNFNPVGAGRYDIQRWEESRHINPHHSVFKSKTTRPNHATEKFLKERIRAKDVRPEDKTDLPGPGTYGIGGIPHKALEERQKKSASTMGMLDTGASGTRTLPQVGSDLGPGCYNFSSFTEDMLKKSVSQRGPYDLFTGERNKPVTTGHYAVPLNQHLGPGTYQLGSFTDNMNSGHSRKKGKFGTVAQYPVKGGERLYVCTLSQMPRDPEDPSPDKYDPKIVADIHYNAKKTPGFLSSAQRNDRMAQKFFTQNFNPVGAGRYDIQRWEESRHINPHHSVFKSKTTRPNHSTEKFLKERIRAKDVRPEDKVYVVEPEHLSAQYKTASVAATKFIAQTAAAI